MFAAIRWISIISITFGFAGVTRAGMPSPLPSEDQWPKVLRLSDTADHRLQVISFFLVGLLVCAAVVRWLWNYLARDLPLPKLRFGKALVMVILWGLLFVIVLTMISGARELMTPGAWKKQGFTYRLDGPTTEPGDVSPAVVQRQHLEQLRQALWHFAATHQGRFPSDDERVLIPADLWQVPETGGLRYRYMPGKAADQPASALVIAPESETGRRRVLRTDGTIAEMTGYDAAAAALSEGRP